jgi:hypothetical protein
MHGLQSPLSYLKTVCLIKLDRGSLRTIKNVHYSDQELIDLNDTDAFDHLKWDVVSIVN